MAALLQIVRPFSARVWAASAPRRYAHDSFAALNVYKDAEKAPTEKPDDEYPDWLWSLLDRPASKEELMQEAEEHFRTGGLDGVLDNMDDARIKRLFKITAKERIKEGNMRRASGEIL